MKRQILRESRVHVLSYLGRRCIYFSPDMIQWKAWFECMASVLCGCVCAHSHTHTEVSMLTKHLSFRLHIFPLPSTETTPATFSKEASLPDKTFSLWSWGKRWRDGGEGWRKVKECHTMPSKVGERARGKSLTWKKNLKKETPTSVWELQTPFEKQNVIPFGILWLGKQPGIILEVSWRVCTCACLCVCLEDRPEI